jgi:hypothetical protein
VTLREREILRLPFWETVLPGGERTPPFLLRRRCRDAARQLQRAGVTRAVFPEQFPFFPEFARAGIYPADSLPLYRAMTGELVQAALRGRPGGAPVAVCADRLTAELRQVVTDLCIRNRYVLLAAPDRNGVFCRQIRREYGAPLVQAENGEQLRSAAVVVLFSPRPGGFSQQTVLELYPGGTLPPFRLALDGEAETQLPADCDRAQLLGALWAAGAIRRGEVTVLPKDGEAEKTGAFP